MPSTKKWTEIEQLPSIKVIEASSDDTSVRKVLLDGGASHDVYHSRTIPEGLWKKMSNWRMDLEKAM